MRFQSRRVRRFSSLSFSFPPVRQMRDIVPCKHLICVTRTQHFLHALVMWRAFGTSPRSSNAFAVDLTFTLITLAFASVIDGVLYYNAIPPTFLFPIAEHRLLHIRASDNEMKFLSTCASMIRLDDLFSASVFLQTHVGMFTRWRVGCWSQTSLQPIPILPATTAMISFARARTRREYRCRRRDVSLLHLCVFIADMPKIFFPQRRRTPAFRAYGNVREVRVAWLRLSDSQCAAAGVDRIVIVTVAATAAVAVVDVEADAGADADADADAVVSDFVDNASPRCRVA